MAAIANLNDYRQSKAVADEAATRERLCWVVAIPVWARFVRQDGDRYWLHIKTTEVLLTGDDEFYCHGELSRADAIWLANRGVAVWSDGKFHHVHDLSGFKIG
ncbi:hypothetical protein ACW16K_004553 [Escherichia coli]